MKKILPIILFLCVFTVSFFQAARPVFAGPAAIPTPDVAFTPDSEVNFVGKAAARSIQFLNWTLQNYNWVCIKRETDGSCNNDGNPLIGFWATIRNIIYAFFALFVLITAFVLISTRGRSLTVKRFLPRFVAVILLVTFSYAILQLIYITGDIIQGFFLAKHDGTNGLISARDLLFVGWDYETFVGLRKVHPFFDESVFVNLLLARMTAVTYYAMTGILLIRKIILWFFIVLSPVFPVLLLYYPIRNTAKIWIGEFFRWLLYAPLFSIFLAGLVTLWKSPAGIPLVFDWTLRDKGDGGIIYPTATNILLGGPAQQVTISNNLNTPDTFAQYVVALIMLWVVILLPFVLLQIFLDYLSTFSLSESPAFQKILTSGYTLLNRPPPVLPPGTPPIPPGDTGIAKQLPWAKYGSAQKIPDIRDTGDARELPVAMPMPRPAVAAIPNTAVLSAANLSVPSMRDIAMFERSMMTQGAPTSQTIQSLQNLANPQSITNPIEREKFNQLRERLVEQSQSGNLVAGAVISAVNIVNNVSTSSNNKVSNLKNALTQVSSPATIPSSIPAVTKDRMTKIHDSLVKESQQGSELANTILSTSKETSLNQMQDIRERLVKESMNNNVTATNILATAMSSVESSTLQQVMKEATSSTQNSQLHDTLVKESEKGNQIASEILNNKELVSTSQIEQFKEKLIDASLQGNQVATTMLSSAISKSEIKTTQQVLTQIANPATVPNTVVREQFTQLKEKLTQAQQKGDQLAGDILTTATNLSKTDLSETVKQQETQALKDKLIEAKAKGNPIAADVLASMSTQTAGTATNLLDAALPQNNRVQTVSMEDYQAVKDMWQENYKTMDVPAGLENRKAWVDAEVKDIDAIVSLLSSDDQSKVQEGMQQVSNILPFLMLGGFSKEEIVSYLKAKQEAGKSVLQNIVTEENDEETMVSVQTHHRTASATMARSEEISTSSEESSSLQQVMTQSTQAMTVNTEALKLTNLPMPTMRDIVRFEVSMLSKNPTNKEQVLKVKETLQQIGNPTSIASETDRQRVTELREKLLQNSKQGDQLAGMILTAAGRVSGALVNDDTVAFKQTLQKLANPAIATEEERAQIQQAHDLLTQEKEKGNDLAAAILSTTDGTNEDTLRTVRQQLHAKAVSDPIAQAVSTLLPKSTTSSTLLPEQNRVQSVSLEDYEAVRAMWQENYKTVDVPEGVDRKEWIVQEGENIDQMIALLSSADPQEVAKGMEQVSNILPFLLLGGFSQAEIVSYLKAKREAGKEVVKELDVQQATEDTMVMVDAHKEQSAATQVMAAEATVPDVQVSVTPAPVSTSPQVPVSPSIPTVPMAELKLPQVQLTDQTITETMAMSGIPVPTLHDLIRYDQSHQERDGAVVKEIEKLRSLLRAIALPDTLTDAQERERVLAIRRALDERKKGDAFAAAIIQAAEQMAGVQSVPEVPEELLQKLRVYIKEIQKPVKQTKRESTVAQQHVAELLERESQRGNQLARSLLLLSPDTTLPEIERIKEQLEQESNGANELAANIVGSLLLQQNAQDLTASLEALSSPQNAPQPYSKETLTTLYARISQEQEQGNQFAKRIMDVIKDPKNADVGAFGQELLQQGEAGNVLAGQLLSLACRALSKESLHEQLLLLVHPRDSKESAVDTESEYLVIHAEAEKANALAEAIISLPLDPDAAHLQAIWKQISDEYRKNNPVAKRITDKIHEIAEYEVPAQVMVAESNRVQTVNVEDYENVRRLWVENYQHADVPAGFSDKTVWLHQEIATVEEAISLLSSSDANSIQKGLSSVSTLLPFLLLGGFSRQEVITYLQAKEAALQDVLKQVSSDTESSVHVTATPPPAVKHMELPVVDNKTSE